MEKVVASFLDDEGNMQFVGESGTVLLVEPGGEKSGEPPPPAPAPMTTHWYKNGEGIMVFFGSRPVGPVMDLQVVLKGSELHGSLEILESDVQPGEELYLAFKDVDLLPWEYAGLATTLYGWATYRNAHGKDAFMGHSMWANAGKLRFEFPERSDPWKFKPLAGQYPENWGHYGLLLEWGIGVY